jgi:hypothetical protein
MPLLHIAKVVLPVAKGVGTGITVSLAWPVVIILGVAVGGYLLFKAER